jgi:hypothetical protein
LGLSRRIFDSSVDRSASGESGTKRKSEVKAVKGTRKRAHSQDHTRDERRSTPEGYDGPVAAAVDQLTGKTINIVVGADARGVVVGVITRVLRRY